MAEKKNRIPDRCLIPSQNGKRVCQVKEFARKDEVNGQTVKAADTKVNWYDEIFLLIVKPKQPGWSILMLNKPQGTVYLLRCPLSYCSKLDGIVPQGDLFPLDGWDLIQRACFDIINDFEHWPMNCFPRKTCG